MIRLFLLLPLLLCAAPAHATGGFSCGPSGNDAVRIDIVIGHGGVSAIAQVRVREGRKLYSTAGEGEPVLLAQSWLDEKGLKLDLVDGDAMRHIARLSISFVTRSAEPLGTLYLNQRRYPVRCTGEQ